MDPKYFSSIGEYTSLLEKHNLTVCSAVLFDRFTPLEGGRYGLRDLVAMFERVALDHLRPDEYPRFLESLEARLRPTLYRDGRWHADYIRLRLVAIRD